MAIELKVKSVEIKSVINSELLVTLEDIDDLQEIQDKDFTGYTLTLSKKKEKTQNANSYMWVLCNKIAQKIRATKEDVYRHAVREVGIYVDMLVPPGNEDEITEAWSKNGIGWFVEPIRYAQKFTLMRFYKGSSVYDREQMSHLIDYIVDECTDLKIPTETPLEIAMMIELWG